MQVTYSHHYKYSLPDGHRFPMDKYPLLLEQLLYEGTIEPHQIKEPKPLSWDQVASTHNPEYIQKLKTLTLSPKEVRKIGFPVKGELISRGLVISGGTYDNALYALDQHSIGLNIAGGTHHSFEERGEGFCVFNDFAIAANLLLNSHQVKKILIVDLDVHQGNGTAHLFRNDPRVFTFSMHGARNYPTKKMISDLDIGLPDGTTDEIYLSMLKAHFPELINVQDPDLIMYLAGVDALANDKLGRLSLSKGGLKARDEFVLEQSKENAIPVIVSMGGGYSSRLSDIIDAHANTFRVAKQIYC